MPLSRCRPPGFLSGFLFGLLIVPLLLAAMVPHTAHAEGEAPPAAAAKPFDVLEFAIDGNSVLPQIDIERAVYPFLGPQRGIAAVEQAREALEKAYHAAGYLTVLVDIPEQKINDDGTVHLRVTEGRVERLKVAGNRYHARDEIRADAPSLAPGTVPNFNDAQQDLAALSRTPDRRVTPLLRPGRAPGTVEVELKVDDSLPLHGSVELNDKQSPDTTARRLEAALRYDNLWQKGHSAALSFQNSPLDTEQVEVYTGTYSLPLGSGTLAGYLVRSNSAIPTLAQTSLGKSTIYGLRYIHPLPGRGSYFHSLTAGFDVKDFDDTEITGAKKPVRYVPFGVQYTAGLTDDSGQWLSNLGVTWSLRSLADREYLCPDDNTVKDQFACKRAGAESNFAVLRGDLQRTQVLGGGWDMTARLDLQAASQPLVPSEQFAAGGVDSVRGYLDAERTGDDGWRTRFELRTPGLWPESGVETRFIGFLDWASLRRQKPLPEEESDYAIGSWGLGMQLRDSSGMRLAFDWARALRDGAMYVDENNRARLRTEKSSSRLHVRVGYDF